MELEKAKNGLNGHGGKAKSMKSEDRVSKSRPDSKISEAAKGTQAEVPSIRLSPEQIEEIHADEYSLTLFYATRVEPLTMNEIKREFPEPEPRKAQAVMDRFIKVGLIHITPEGAYYSNYPENYINYSHYRYDGDLEARKDAKVFQLMKEFTGKSEYWKDKTYFSMDAFYSKEQSDELIAMFKAIKVKAKEYANENAKKKTIRGLRFRRLKFYDMTFAILFALLMSLGISDNAFAGGNDPVMRMFRANPDSALNFLAVARFAGGGGNDPTAALRSSEPKLYYASLVSPVASDSGSGGGGHDPDAEGGGGHDPSNPPKGPACYLEFEGQTVAVKSPRICKLKRLIDVMNSCGDSQHPRCVEAERQTDLLIQRVEKESVSE